MIPKVEPANSALVLGQVSRTEAPLVRIHSGCHTGDIFSSLRCDCGAQLDQSLGKISNEGCGIAIYLADQEGRGIGLWAKAAAYLLQEEGADTYEANRRLGCPDDSRRYNDAALVLGNFLDGRRIRLMSNNPAKQRAFEELGFDVVEMCGLAAGHHKLNRGYLEAKARQGHILPDLMRN